MKKLNILVPFDGSEYSKRALDKAIEICKDSDSRLRILMAVNPPSVEPPGVAVSSLFKGKSATKAMKEFVEHAYQIANQTVEQNAEYARKKGARASCDVVGDNPSKAILESARKNNSDLIVMGSQGLRGIRKLRVLGSVSRHVLENATCPVLIVH